MQQIATQYATIQPCGKMAAEIQTPYTIYQTIRIALKKNKDTYAPRTDIILDISVRNKSCDVQQNPVTPWAELE